MAISEALVPHMRNETRDMQLTKWLEVVKANGRVTEVQRSDHCYRLSRWQRRFDGSVADSRRALASCTVGAFEVSSTRRGISAVRGVCRVAWTLSS